MAQIVEGPTRQPLPFGLFSVLTPRPSGDDRWQMEGVQWETLACTPASGIGDPCAEDVTGLPKNLGVSGGDLGEGSAFTVYGSYTCNPIGTTFQTVADRATQHLLTREEARVEQAVWTGDLDNTGFVTGAEDAGAGTLKRGIANLEGWLATNYGSKGVIHMTRAAALLAIDAGVVEVKGSTLQTKIGTPVVAGAGYPGTGPTGQAPAANSTYIYATPAMLGYRTDVFPGVDPVEAGLNRSKNDLHAVSERTYLVGWDPCGTAYALVTLPE
jgi:hypothetical protein